MSDAANAIRTADEVMRLLAEGDEVMRLRLRIHCSLAYRKLYDITTDTVREMTEAEVTATRAWLEGIPHAQ